MSDTPKTNPEVEQKDSNLTENLGMEYVPKKDRTHWINPALIYWVIALTSFRLVNTSSSSMG